MRRAARAGGRTGKAISTDREQKVTGIFHSALGREGAERRAFLDGACAGDPGLRREVALLIEAHESAGSFIDGTAYEREGRVCPQTLMGGAEQGDQFSVAEPVGKVVLSVRPTLRWSRLEGATAHVVEVYDKSSTWRPPARSSPVIRGGRRGRSAAARSIPGR